jgi:GNAT superfamily N-acetyltransferase
MKHPVSRPSYLDRQSVMVAPSYQRQGLGSMLTRKCNEMADEVDKIIYAYARPTSAGLYVTEGYESLERIDADLGNYGVEGGETSVFVMKESQVPIRILEPD